jgi:hypothetical protein
VHAEHQCGLGRVEVEPDDVSQLVDDLGIRRHEGRFTVCYCSARKLPDFHVRIEYRAGLDGWELTELLPSPRAVGPRLRRRVTGEGEG